LGTLDVPAEAERDPAGGPGRRGRTVRPPDPDEAAELVGVRQALPGEGEAGEPGRGVRLLHHVAVAVPVRVAELVRRCEVGALVPGVGADDVGHAVTLCVPRPSTRPRGRTRHGTRALLPETFNPGETSRGTEVARAMC